MDELWGTRLTVKTLRPGTASIRLAAGGLERVMTVRVADPSEVVSGTLRLAAPEAHSGDLQADADIVGEVVPASTEIFPVSLVPVWTLSDGTTVLGGAGRVQAQTAGVEIGCPGSPTAQDVEIMELMAGGVDCRPGTVRLGARMGSAPLDFSYVQECP